MKGLIILLVVVGAIAGAYKVVLVMRERRSQRAQVALAEIMCESELMGELVDFAGAATKGQARGAQAAIQLGDLMGKLDQELAEKGVTREDTEALGKGTLGTSAMPLNDKVHEACPDSYNEDPGKYQKVVVLVFGYYAARNAGVAP